MENESFDLARWATQELEAAIWKLDVAKKAYGTAGGGFTSAGTLEGPRSGHSEGGTYVAPGSREAIIRTECEAEWPDDYRMQAYCVNKQQEALSALDGRSSVSANVPYSVFETIRAECAKEWPNDFDMRDYCERRQLEAYHELY